jgi:uncharacterized membrane-anchored protein
MSKQQALIQAAVVRGLLPANAAAENITRPWPIVLMTGLGAWLAAIPLVAVVFITAGNELNRGSLSYILGATFLCAAIYVLRAASNEFVEQLGVPALLVAGVLLGMSFYRDLPPVAAGGALALLIIAAAWAVPQTWLRALLGVLACAAFIAMIANRRTFDAEQLWGGLQSALLVWAVAMLWADSRPVSAINAGGMIALESMASGWVVLILVGLAYNSGKTFMLGALLAPFHVHGLAAITSDPWPRALSLASAAAGAAWLARQWPVLRAPRFLLAAGLLAALCWLIPLLGGALLVLAICAASSRWLLAAAAGVSAAWIVGSFYYQLDVPLAAKAVIMTCAGAAFGLIAWLNWQRPQRAAPAAAAPPRLMAGLAVSLATTLIIVNGGIWQKENLISNGRQVFIELAPVDPRSLMQGDYMALNFHLPNLGGTERRVKVLAHIDARGVAVMQHVADERPLAQDEILIELLRTGSGLRPASDAWYFKEGEAGRWAKARYGEFRIDSSGHALLVDLRGADLQKL